MDKKLNGYTRIGMWICRISQNNYVLECYRIDNPNIKKKPIIRLSTSQARLRYARGDFDDFFQDIKEEVENA